MARRPGPADGWTALTIVALALSAGIAGFSIYAVYRLHVVLPIWDAWATIADGQMVRAGTYGWTELTRQHNEHRLLFPRLLFLVDQALFAMSDRDLLAETFALQAVTAAVLLRLGSHVIGDRRFRAILAGFLVIVLFSLDQEQNFTSGFQVQFVGVFTAAALASVAYTDGLDRFGATGLAGVRRPGGWTRIGLAGVGCFVATYTMANGMLAGFVLAALAVLVRAPWRVTLATVLAAAAFAALYLHGYVGGTLSRPLAVALSHPLPYLRFLAAYLGNPVGTNPALAEAFGATGLMGFGLAIVRVGTGRTRRPADAALLAIMGFVVGTACATSYGRIEAGLEQAFETRYLTPTAVFWCAFVIFWFGEAVRTGTGGTSPGRRTAALALVSLMALLVGRAVYLEATAWPFMVDQTIAIRRFRDSLWSGLYDPAAASYEINPDSELRVLLATLRADRLSLFAAPEANELGRPVGSLGEIAPPSTCAGTVAATVDPALGRDGVRLTGTAWDVGADRPIRRVVTIGPAGTVAGFGSPDRPVGRPRPWTGYATVPAGEPVSAYAVLRDERVCDLGQTTVAAR